MLKKLKALLKTEAPVVADPGGVRTVLLVDDESIIRILVSELLEGVGRYRVIGEADNGPDAVQLYTDKRPDLVLLDVEMPGGPDGLSTLKAILAVNPAARVIILSGISDKVRKLQHLSDGAAAIMDKRELDQQALLATLDAVHWES